MSRLLTDHVKNALPTFRTQEFVKDLLVYAVFFFPGSGWTWFVTEGQPEGNDFIFFGFVIGFESEWGYFTLNELEEINIHDLVVESDEAFKRCPLSNCLPELAAERAKKVS